MTETLPKERDIVRSVIEICKDCKIQSIDEIVRGVRITWSVLEAGAKNDGTPFDTTPSRIEHIILTMIKGDLISPSFRVTIRGMDLYDGIID